MAIHTFYVERRQVFARALAKAIRKAARAARLPEATWTADYDLTTGTWTVRGLVDHDEPDEVRRAVLAYAEYFDVERELDRGVIRTAPLQGCDGYTVHVWGVLDHKTFWSERANRPEKSGQQ